MKRSLITGFILLSVMLLCNSCTRKYNSFWVGHRGHYVVRRHGILPHFAWGHKHYGKHVKLRPRRRHMLKSSYHFR